MSEALVAEPVERDMFGPEIQSAAGQWYAVYTRSNSEFKVSQQLRSRGVEEFLPVYRSRRHWCDRIKELDMPLFTGYVFCRFDARRPLQVASTPGVVRIIGGGRTPVPVRDIEIESIRAICTSGLRAEPWPFLEVGRRVAVVAGPLAGVEGIVVELKSQYRLVVSISLLQRSVAAEIEREWIEPLASSSAGRA